MVHSGTDSDAHILQLNSNGAQNDYGSTYGTLAAANATTFAINGIDGIGGGSATYQAFIWHNVDGLQRFGKYEGNANNNGTFVWTGFKPQIVWIKEIDNADDWCVYNTVEVNTYNDGNTSLQRFDTSTTNYSDTSRAIDFYGNGFKMKTSNNTINQSSTFIYCAWGQVPWKYNNGF
jgi:hypothetical protein